MKTPYLFFEQRVAIVRKRLNEDTLDRDLSLQTQRRVFALDLIDVLDGNTGTLTAEERKRFKVRR